MSGKSAVNFLRYSDSTYPRFFYSLDSTISRRNQQQKKYKRKHYYNPHQKPTTDFPVFLTPIFTYFHTHGNALNGKNTFLNVSTFTPTAMRGTAKSFSKCNVPSHRRQCSEPQKSLKLYWIFYTLNNSRNIKYVINSQTHDNAQIGKYAYMVRILQYHFT